MGGAVSAGDTNDELVDNLIEENFIRSDHIKEAFRAVDRGSYYLPEHRSTAYHDMAWKHQNLHLSAPCIYSEVMEHLDLKPGLSFLNLGSGTGYVNTMVGLILGPTGINHGIEIHEDVVEYANEKLQQFIESSPSFDWFDFCPPQFICGNGLKIPIDTLGYDRIYCGADCPVLHKSYICNLLNINGVMVVPMDDHLDVIKRTGQSTWESNVVMSVSFASLLQPPSEEPVQLPKRYLPTLYNLCRYRIRRAIRDHCLEDIKEEKRKRRRKKKKTKLSDEDLGNNICRALNTDTVSSDSEDLDDEEDHGDEEEDVDIDDETEIENVPTSSPTNGINNHNATKCSSTNNGKNNNTTSHDADGATGTSKNKMTDTDVQMDAEEVASNEEESKEDTSNAHGDDSLNKVKPDNGDRSKNVKMEDNDKQMENEEDELVGSHSDIPSSNSSAGSSRRESDDDDNDASGLGLQRFMLRRRMFHLQNPRTSSRTPAERGMMAILSSVLRRRRTPSKTLTSGNETKRMKPVDAEVEDVTVDSMSEDEEDEEILHIEDTSFTQSILTLPLPPVVKKYLLYNRVEID